MLYHYIVYLRSILYIRYKNWFKVKRYKDKIRDNDVFKELFLNKIQPIFHFREIFSNDRVCIKELVAELNINIRNYKHDFKLLREYFLDKLIKSGDCYIFLNRKFS